ncbi:MAG: OmpW family protein [Magnetococcales bacterium]|nr:OmpW family protein [Magnetococcales bacterium]
MSWIALLAVVMILSSSQAQALEQGDWMFRLGASYVAPMDDSGEVQGVAGSGVGVDAASTVGFTIGGMITDHLAIELFGITPSNHELNGEGSLPGVGISDVGDVDVFPPTLSINWYPTPKSRFRPHIGIGVSGTVYMDPDTSSEVRAVLGPDTDLDIDNTFGFGGNIGIDYDISENTFLSLGVWYIHLEADAMLRGTTSGDLSVDVDVNPLVGFVALGMHF